ncbi:MAG: hypothetical protein JJ971_01885 [Balneolaceae bacterium]|nr:hypothetical protein [Balneolaceae bacterium]MBO6545123.1 hypothetical protein [Balneolaceae bacterium]MBO6646519.1 hypothetical protein [Balneolaceae bacterium]
MNTLFSLTTKLLSGAFLLLIACTAEAQTIEKGILRDVSDSSHELAYLDADEVFLKVLTQLELKNSTKGVILRTAVFGKSRIPEIQVATLPEQNRLFGSSSERTKHMRQFLAKAKSDIDYMVSQPTDQRLTNLYRALVHMTSQFDPEAEVKTVIVFSDLIEASSIFNATTYASNPALLIENYDSIVKTFEQDMSLPDLSGFTIHLITPGTSDLHLWMSRFWSKFLASKGAQVEVRASF